MILYCGGGLSACDSAMETAMNGKKVAIIEMLDEAAMHDHLSTKRHGCRAFAKDVDSKYHLKTRMTGDS